MSNNMKKYTKKFVYHSNKYSIYFLILQQNVLCMISYYFKKYSIIYSLRGRPAPPPPPQTLILGKTLEFGLRPLLHQLNSNEYVLSG